MTTRFARCIAGLAGVMIASSLLSGCMTSRSASTTAGQPVTAEINLDQRPELEPEWGAYVKQRYPNWRQHYWVDRGQWGNRGYLVGTMTGEGEAPVTAAIKPFPPETMEPPTIIESEPPSLFVDEPPPVATTEPAAPERIESYIVSKGDTLWRIAGKVYGNPLRWGEIYRANKDKIKNPHKIYPGQVLVIPWD